MGFLLFYLCALIPIAVGVALLTFSRRYTWHEWLASSLLSFAVAGVCHWFAIQGMVADEETWSGHVTSVQYQPEWTERYEEAVYRTVTDSKGNTSTEFSHYETRYARHPEEWTAHSVIGRFRMDRAHYDQLVRAFGGRTEPALGDRSGDHGGTMSSGDPMDYVTQNETGHIEPVAKSVAFENRVKASPSVFSYAPLSEEERAGLPDYPVTRDTWSTGRNMNSGIPSADWDALNGVLGPAKFVNLVIVRLPSEAASRRLEAHWVGGKKNDLVLTFGDGWARVFGWTQSSLVKRNLEALLVEHPVNRAILPLIEAEVRKNYVKTDWHRFDYLDLQPRPVHFAYMLGLQAVFGAVAVFISLRNGLTKDGNRLWWEQGARWRR